MLKQIESSSNPAIRKVRRILGNRDTAFFHVEGKKLLEEALESGIELREVFVTKEFWQKERRWLSTIEEKGIPINLVPNALMKILSDVESPSGLVGIASRPAKQDFRLPGTFAIFLYSVRDPGNFGAILRSAEASGCESLIHTHDCVDPFLPKVVRASMGSIFRVPLYEVRDAAGTLNAIGGGGVNLYALSSHAMNSLYDVRPILPAVLLIGSEAGGFPENISVKQQIKIPMLGRVESLNTAVAAALGLYWLASARY